MSDPVQTWHYGLMARHWAENNTTGPEIAYFQQQIEQYGQPALDAGCGTGRLLIPFLRAGLDVDGCDISPDMLAYCQQSAAAESLSPRLYQQALHELDLPRRYQTIVACGAFGLGVSRAQDFVTLQRFYDHLLPGGLLILDSLPAYADAKEWPLWHKDARAHLPEAWPAAIGNVPEEGRQSALYYRLVAVDPLAQQTIGEMRMLLFEDGQMAADDTYTLVSGFQSSLPAAPPCAFGRFGQMRHLSGLQERNYTMFTIRPFHATDEEYARVVEINNTLWPDDLTTVENVKYADAERNSSRFFQRLIIELAMPSALAEEQGKIIGEARCGEEQWKDDPGRYFVNFCVDPRYAQLEYGENGIGIAVMAYVLNRLRQREPKPNRLITHCREDKADRLAFLKEQGYTAAMRSQESELDVTTFDPAPFVDKVQQVKLLGIEILTLLELSTRFNDWMARLYEMDMEILPDEPTTGKFTPEPIEEYAKMFSHPSFLAEGWIVALDGGQCVGSSSVWNNPANPQKLYTNFTGVRRSHRRKGVAVALKLALIEYVQRRGATRIITSNEENNPMYQINVQLGFKPRPGWLEFHKQL